MNEVELIRPFAKDAPRTAKKLLGMTEPQKAFVDAVASTLGDDATRYFVEGAIRYCEEVIETMRPLEKIHAKMIYNELLQQRGAVEEALDTNEADFLKSLSECSDNGANDCSCDKCNPPMPNIVEEELEF